ncbi:DNA polymerase III subunit epsilon [Curvibacter sp. APW13]|uniref:DNA polymerase III subunit epsilon n=1 Tax=Curvibacter sp. APW13 TaxID=3077236 RepID=UPI0028DEF5C2|nr:DNA polymerase III subunit epsilon [Curvibacter sp. APW13]MDT8991469.1 DNA polymerase III subunit epsilon [Curvibacter sp. APW13]
MRQVFLDTETTGLDPNTGDRIVEIGCVELVKRKLTGNNLHIYLNPERDMPEEAERIHGLSSEFLADKPKFAEVVDQFLDYVDGAEIIIHNADFDVGFLNAELKRLGRTPFPTHVSGIVDSLAMAKEMFPGKRNSLDALCSRLEVDNSGRKFHGALLDAELLADVYVNMTRGQDALLMDAGPSSASGTEAGLGGGQAIDLSAFDLPVLQANAQELAAHDDVLAQIDKGSGGKTVWRKHEPLPAAP